MADKEPQPGRESRCFSSATQILLVKKTYSPVDIKKIITFASPE